jgi:tRNA(fMet)-specific endonuclease VapC
MAAGPTAYVLDTNILVHFIRDNELSRRLEARYTFRAPTVRPLISVVTEGELEALSLQFGWGVQRQQRLRTELGRVTTVPLDFERIIPAYARIVALCRRINYTMGQNDMWIAATAHATGARLITTDRDFGHLDPAFISRDWIDPTNPP